MRTQGNERGDTRRRESDTRGRTVERLGDTERRARTGETDHVYRSRSAMQRARDRDRDREWERDRARSADAARDRGWDIDGQSVQEGAARESKGIFVPIPVGGACCCSLM